MQAFEHSQVVVPQSFVDLFVPPGRARALAPREQIAARHDLCEDLAQALTEHASALLSRRGATEQDVIEQVLAGLLSAESGLANEEAMWVARRLAELLDWRDIWL